MLSSTEMLFTIGSIISVFSTLIILMASIILFIKKKTLATWIILIGTILVFVTYIGNIILNVFASRGNMDTLLLLQGVSNIIQSLSYLIFTVGLTILAITEFSKKKP
ncbi:hypothetical protein HSX10_12110 [Winogradskyella undariae]|uniref:hypothetical protein n=1 Tax=Winogradskyella TaxID=286104 RepID=UPI00156A8FB4|nr:MULTISPECIES: hypothetical protein [Winogradskyella]NRR92312.1 hypothetical protein [Winogradskyella undariae]QXP78341.1 hypothetical protein H0I32_14125 [Winogradskyella sp. HaHa_3_26]